MNSHPGLVEAKDIWNADMERVLRVFFINMGKSLINILLTFWYEAVCCCAKSSCLNSVPILVSPVGVDLA